MRFGSSFLNDNKVGRLATNVADTAVMVLEEAVASLQLELHDRDQERLDNDVLITNVVREQVSVLQVVTVIGARLDVKLGERNVV